MGYVGLAGSGLNETGLDRHAGEQKPLRSCVSIEERIPAIHRLRRNRKLADQVRDRLNPLDWKELKTRSELGGVVGENEAEWMIMNGLS